MNKGRMFGYEKKPMPEGMTFFTHPNTEESVLPLILAGTPPTAIRHWQKPIMPCNELCANGTRKEPVCLLIHSAGCRRTSL